MKTGFLSLLLTFTFWWVLGVVSGVCAGELPRIDDVDYQPVGVHVRRLIDALEALGRPLSQQQVDRLQEASRTEDDDEAIRIVQDVLDPLCLVGVTINPESRVKAVPGPASRQVVQNGWTVFLVKVQNDAGVTAPLGVDSDESGPVWNKSRQEGRNRWLGVAMFDQRPLAESLSGLPLEYRIVQVYSRDAGKRAAVLNFNVGQGSQDLGFRSDVLLTFDCRPATPVTFRVRDENGEPSVASLVIRDDQGRVYPAQSKRLAPDFHFHPQVYRADGEKVELPEGEYQMHFGRGPEYLVKHRTVRVERNPVEVALQLERWIDPSTMGWWSGDHHIHAAGCAHYSEPTKGVHADDMIRHCLGEDLKIGANLTWGPCFDYQKQFFTGRVDPVSQYPYLLRYDVEVSGFGSHQSGHLCLLRLTRQIPEGGDSKHHWPTLCLNTLRWAKKQGAVVGPAHSGWGLAVDSQELPNFELPPFDGIGANEYIVDVTHQVQGPDGEPVPAVDFLSTVDTPYPWELNIWYHTLNCGFRTRISGETDFPCIYGERVGLGRAYVRVDGPLTYNKWCEGVRQGRAYVSDGYSHLIGFKVEDVPVGVGRSKLQLEAPAAVVASARVAARLDEEPRADLQNLPVDRKPYWHLERARVGDSREVLVELIVNGYSVAEKRIVADGSLQDISFETQIDRSGWIAMRILPSSHTNPIFVVVNDAPVRASRRSAQWCLEGVDRCWSQKERFIADAEMDDALAAYEHARQVYRRIRDESAVD